MKSSIFFLCLFGAHAIFLRSDTKAPEKAKFFKQTLHNHMNVQYFADFDIGGQKIAGIFDTGSFELLVRSTRCANCMHPTPAYNHEKSFSYVKQGNMTQHVFGSGPCRSMLGYDTVSVGPLHSEKQAFWEITSHRIPILDTAVFAAIVGIGPNFGFGSKKKTLLMSFGIDEFSICLQKPRGAPGYLTWGPSETPHMKRAQFATVKVYGKHHWATKLTAVSFKGLAVSADGKGKASLLDGEEKAKDGADAKEKDGADAKDKDKKAPFDIMKKTAGFFPCGARACTAIIDSGTSLIAAPGMALMQLAATIPKIKEDCSNLNELPNLNFVLDGILFTLPPQAYVMRVTGALMEANDIWDILFFKPKIRKMDMCMPAFMQMDMMSKTGESIWILGMPFFRYYHTTFDRKNEQMHFAVAGPDCEPRPFMSKHTNALISFNASDKLPLEVDIGSIIPPTLSEMIDYPFESGGEYEV